MSTQAQRYSAVAIVLHWAIAFAILFMIPLGLWMHEQAEDGVITDSVFRAFQLHKSVGLTVLVLSLVRLAWRLMNPPPPMPEHMPAWERFIARATHWAFYALMLGLPLTGWLYVSTGWSIHDDQPLVVNTVWFGLIQVPHLFGLNNADPDLRETVADLAFNAHALLAWAAVGLAVLHMAAALKHHFFDRDEILAHMVPGLRAPFETTPRPKQTLRLAVLGVGLGATVIAMAALVFAALSYIAPAENAPQAQSDIEIAEPTAPNAPTAEELAPVEPGAPARWAVDTRASSVGFAFTYDDGESGPTRFEGRFTRWRADIRFDEANLDQSSAVVTIQTDSATDGVEIHDRSLPGPDWFNTSGYPSAVFRTERIRRRGEGYVAEGTLQIKDRTRDVTLPFTLVISGDRATMRGSVSIDRQDFDLGEGTDADDMISRDVEISVRVDAVRQP
jgi:cytochrome b561/polyisoprenoid-binding protein YceI